MSTNPSPTITFNKNRVTLSNFKGGENVVVKVTDSEGKIVLEQPSSLGYNPDHVQDLTLGKGTYTITVIREDDKKDKPVEQKLTTLRPEGLEIPL